MTYTELQKNTDYNEIAQLRHSEMKEFIVGEMEKNQGYARIINMYQVVGMLAFILGLFKAFMPFYTQREWIYLVYLTAGLLFTCTFLILIHELIHALAYRYVGVRHLSFGMNLKKFMFYVQADKQVLTYKQFRVVALAPTVVVAALSFLGMIIFYQQPIFYFFLPILAFHALFCGGDFGLLCFFQNRTNMDIVTFDVKNEGKTYFYGKEK